jgi:hypothetical protein
MRLPVSGAVFSIATNSRAGAVISYNQHLIALALCYDNRGTGI